MFKILNTDQNDKGSLIARVTLGIVILPHGLQKLAGLFGGYGITGTIKYFVSVGIPKIVGLMVISGESFGSILLIIGLVGRFSAASLIMIMSGAVLMIHIHNGFFMNWFGNQAGEGYEYHMLVIGLALIIFFKGSGKWSLDASFSRKYGK